MQGNIRYSFKELYTPRDSVFPSLKGKSRKKMPQQNVKKIENVPELLEKQKQYLANMKKEKQLTLISYHLKKRNLSLTHKKVYTQNCEDKVEKQVRTLQSQLTKNKSIYQIRAKQVSSKIKLSEDKKYLTEKQKNRLILNVKNRKKYGYSKRYENLKTISEKDLNSKYKIKIFVKKKSRANSKTEGNVNISQLPIIEENSQKQSEKPQRQMQKETKSLGKINNEKKRKNILLLFETKKTKTNSVKPKQQQFSIQGWDYSESMDRIIH